MGENRKGERPSREAWVVQGLVNLTCGGMLLLMGHWLASGGLERACWGLALDRGAFLSYATALSLAALGLDTAAAVRAGRPRCTWVAWALVLMLGCGAGKLQERHIKSELWSCCFHGRGWRYHLDYWLGRNWRGSLASGEDMWKLAETIGLETRTSPGWDWTCPLARDEQGGWRYVGGGLPAAVLGQYKLLVALESHGHHPPGDDHAHGARATSERHCYTHSTLAEEIRRCLDLHRRGLAPYSPAAVRILETELAARQLLAAARP